MDLQVDTAEELADWTEASVLANPGGLLTRDQIESLAKLELGVSSYLVSSAMSLLRKRAKVLGEAYPFKANDLAVHRWHSGVGPYELLLCITPNSVARQTVRAGDDVAVMGRFLEELSELGLANLWGLGGQALAFGYPSQHGRPEAFHAAVAWLAEKMSITVGSGYRPPIRKDGGVYVVAWRSFADGRPGFPIALAQCTIQNAFITKTRDVDLRLWASWLALDVDPLNLLVIPGTVSGSGTTWKQLTTVVTVVERLRLMELLCRSGDVALSPEQAQWSETTLAGLRTVLRAGEL